MFHLSIRGIWGDPTIQTHRVSESTIFAKISRKIAKSDRCRRAARANMPPRWPTRRGSRLGMRHRVEACSSQAQRHVSRAAGSPAHCVPRAGAAGPDSDPAASGGPRRCLRGILEEKTSRGRPAAADLSPRRLGAGRAAGPHGGDRARSHRDLPVRRVPAPRPDVHADVPARPGGHAGARARRDLPVRHLDATGPDRHADVPARPHASGLQCLLQCFSACSKCFSAFWKYVSSF